MVANLLRRDASDLDFLLKHSDVDEADAVAVLSTKDGNHLVESLNVVHVELT